MKPFYLADYLPYWMSVDDFYVGLTGIAAFFAAFTIGKSFMERDTMGPRVKALKERRQQLANATMTSRRTRKKPETSVNFMRSVAMKLKLVKKSGVGQVESLLVEAGMRSKDAIYIYAFFQLLFPLIFLGLGFFVMNMDFWDGSKLVKFRITTPVFFAYFGFKLPLIYVRRKRKKRYLGIQRALSDTLDLMTICAEAGLSLAAALERVSRELGIAYPAMAEELLLTSIELGFLPDRNKALLNLSERVKIQEIRGIVSVLIQTEKYGTPIAQAMRVLSAEFRQQRMLRAEAKAARLPAIMTVPMILFILPTIFIVIMTPSVIKIMDM